MILMFHCAGFSLRVWRQLQKTSMMLSKSHRVNISGTRSSSPAADPSRVAILAFMYSFNEKGPSSIPRSSKIFSITVSSASSGFSPSN